MSAPDGSILSRLFDRVSIVIRDMWEFNTSKHRADSPIPPDEVACFDGRLWWINARPPYASDTDKTKSSFTFVSQKTSLRTHSIVSNYRIVHRSFQIRYFPTAYLTQRTFDVQHDSRLIFLDCKELCRRRQYHRKRKFLIIFKAKSHTSRPTRQRIRCCRN